MLARLDVDVVAVHLDEALPLGDADEGAGHRDLRPVRERAAQGDQVAVVGTVGGILGEAQVNIAGMQVARDAKGGHALVALSVDSAIPAAVLEEISVAMGAASVRAVDLSE